MQSRVPLAYVPEGPVDRFLDEVALVAGLPLDRGDLVYVSPYVEEGASSASPAAWEQARRMKETMTPRGAGGPRGAVYDIRLFAY